MDVLFNQATVGLAECNTDGIFLRVNDYFCRMVGLSRTELIGHHLSEVLLPEDLPRVHALLSGRMSGDRYEIEKMHLRSDGEEVWTRVAASLVRDANGRPQRALAVYVDITEDKKREAALRESEARFRLLADSLPGFVWAADANGDVIYANDRWHEATGMDPSEVYGSGWISALHPDDVNSTLAIWHQVRLLGIPYNTEFRYRCADGSYRWFAARARPHRDPGTGKVIAWFGISIDINEQKTAAMALRESEQRLKATYEHAAIGIAEVDTNRRLLTVNEWLYNLSGYTKEEVIGREYQDFLIEEDRAKDVSLFHRLMAKELDTYTIELRIRHKDGHIIWGDISASRVDDEHGRPLYGIRVVRDVTTSRRAEETRTLLMHELNHRVKNTLSTVQSIVSQGLRKTGAPPEAKEDIETRLFALSRAHDVLTRESWEGAWLAEVVVEAIGPYRREGSERFRIGGPDVRLNTSQALAISMAVHELSTNAAKYGSLSADTGRVEIAWSIIHSPTSRRLHFRWKESGGAPVEPPRRRGFGTRLIERGLASELAGEVKIDFALDGVECVADVPLL